MRFGRLARCRLSGNPTPLKQELEQLLLAALAKLTGSVLARCPRQEASWSSARAMRSTAISRPTLRCAWRRRHAGIRASWPPAIVAALPPSELIARTEVAGAGFINFHLAPTAYAAELARIHAQAATYGHSAVGGGERVLVEFVSANPTGPLHVGHGRQAAYGATLSNLLRGHRS